MDKIYYMARCLWEHEYYTHMGCLKLLQQPPLFLEGFLPDFAHKDLLLFSLMSIIHRTLMLGDKAWLEVSVPVHPKCV